MDSNYDRVDRFWCVNISQPSGRHIAFRHNSMTRPQVVEFVEFPSQVFVFYPSGLTRSVHRHGGPSHSQGIDTYTNSIVKALNYNRFEQL